MNIRMLNINFGLAVATLPESHQVKKGNVSFIQIFMKSYANLYLVTESYSNQIILTLNLEFYAVRHFTFAFQIFIDGGPFS